MASPIRMTGLTSGLDTESIVKALTSNYQNKVDKNKKAQTKLSWKQDAWKEINKKVYSLYSSLDSLRYSSGYKLQKATCSDTTKATVTSSGSAFTGTQ
ncbi:MAG: flagellar hook protein, partial [Lachnospiraceae bacterium]|nr:flagellar hook protein [Lachnospiraceae bacterium]